MGDEKYINQLEINGKLAFDLTGDSVTPETLAFGETAHNAAGEPIIGTGKVNNDFVIHVMCSPEYLADETNNGYWVRDPYRMTFDQFWELIDSGKNIILEITVQTESGWVTLTANPVKNNLLTMYSATHDSTLYKFLAVDTLGITAADGSVFDGLTIQCLTPVVHVTTEQVTTYLSAESTDKQLPSALAVVSYVDEAIENVGSGNGGDNNIFIVEFGVSLSANGLALTLPSNITFEDISLKYDNDCHVVGSFEVPSAAGDLAGKYIAPLNKKDANGNLMFIATTESRLLWVKVTSSGQISFGQSLLELTPNKVSSISASSTNVQYPSAKAVYDYVNANSGGGSGTAVTEVFNVTTFTNDFEVEEINCSFTDLVSAINAGKLIVLNGKAAHVTSQNSSQVKLAFWKTSGQEEWTIGSDGWVSTANSKTYLTSTDTTGVVNASSTHQKLPTAKAVYDARQIEYVQCSLDLSTMSITEISHTNQQLLNLINANKQCVLICSTPFGPVYGSLAHMDAQSNDVQFSIMLYANMGQGFNLYYFHMFVHANDTVELTTKLISLIG